jgi:hypothetical protein
MSLLVLGKKLSTRKATEVLKNLSGNVVLVFENEKPCLGRDEQKRKSTGRARSL